MSAKESQNSKKRSVGNGVSAPEGKRLRRKPRKETFKKYISGVMKQVHPDLSITGNSLSIVNGMVNYIFNRIGLESYRLLNSKQRKTIGQREIQFACYLLIPGELAKHAVSEINKSVIKFMSVVNEEKNREKVEGEKTKPVTKSQKAGLQFSVSRVFRHLKRNGFAKQVSPMAAVSLAATLEYLVAEVVQLAGNVAKGCKHHRITPRDIFLAIRNDEELNILFENGVIANSGAIPYISPNFLPKRKQTKVVKV